jgi:hypothetical protein
LKEILSWEKRGLLTRPSQFSLRPGAFWSLGENKRNQVPGQVLLTATRLSRLAAFWQAIPWGSFLEAISLGVFPGSNFPGHFLRPFKADHPWKPFPWGSFLMWVSIPIMIASFVPCPSLIRPLRACLIRLLSVCLIRLFTAIFDGRG